MHNLSEGLLQRIFHELLQKFRESSRKYFKDFLQNLPYIPSNISTKGIHRHIHSGIHSQNFRRMAQVFFFQEFLKKFLSRKKKSTITSLDNQPWIPYKITPPLPDEIFLGSLAENRKSSMYWLRNCFINIFKNSVRISFRNSARSVYIHLSKIISEIILKFFRGLLSETFHGLFQKCPSNSFNKIIKGFSKNFLKL